MAEETNSGNPKNNILMKATARDQSKVTMVGQLNAEKVQIDADLKSVLDLLEQIGKVPSAAPLKAGNPYKSLAHWQGRTEEITQLNQWLNDKNITLIGIEGIGGTGKSMLAAKIYEEVEGFPKRFWADVTYGPVFSDLARKILTEFGYPVPEQESELVKALVKCLQSGQYLLIIDNLESLLKADRQWNSQFYGDFFKEWVECRSNSTVLITTRERPEFRGFKWLPLKGLTVEQGVALLAELGITGDLKAFSQLVDGHPLLLRLVADLLKEEYSQDPNLKRLADLGLGNLQQLLTNPKVVGQHRRENVGMVLVLDTSFERLSDLQKTLLLNLSVYRGAFDREAALAMSPEQESAMPEQESAMPEQESAMPEQESAMVEEELRKLVRHSLLLEKLNGKREFDFQPVVLEYLRYKAKAGDQTEAHKKAIEYYRSVTKPSEWKTLEDVAEYLEIFYHYCQLHQYAQAFNALQETSSSQKTSCDSFLEVRGYNTIRVNLYAPLEKQWKPTDDERDSFAEMLNCLGVACRSIGQYPPAIELHKQALGIFQKLCDRARDEVTYLNPHAVELDKETLAILRKIYNFEQGKATSKRNLGKVYLDIGEYQQAEELMKQALQISQSIEDGNGEFITLCALVDIYKKLRRYQDVINSYLEILKLCQQNDNRYKADVLNEIGSNYKKIGYDKEAIDAHKQALQISQKLNYNLGKASALLRSGYAHQSLKHYKQAIEFFEQALPIFRDLGNREGESCVLVGLGNAYSSQGQYLQAIEYYDQALVISRELGDREGEAIYWHNLAVIYECQNKHQDAIDSYQKSLAIKREIGNHEGQALTLCNLGVVYFEQERYQEAIASYNESLNISCQLGALADEARTRRNLGKAYNALGLYYYGEGKYQKAIRAYRRALRFFCTIGDRFRIKEDDEKKAQTQRNLGDAYNALGQRYSNQREYQRAVKLHQRAFNFFRIIDARFCTDTDRDGEANALSGLANACYFLDQYPKAVESHQKSLKIRRNRSDRAGEADALLGLGKA